MPNITATGTYTKDDEGFEFLQFKSTREYNYMTLLFAGTTLPTSLTIQYTDDEGTDRTFEDGTITTLPTSLVIEWLNKPIKIVVTGGSPDFNVTWGR